MVVRVSASFSLERGSLLALSASPLAALFAFFLASTKVPSIVSLFLGLVQEEAESN